MNLSHFLWYRKLPAQSAFGTRDALYVALALALALRAGDLWSAVA